ncbi:MAG: hypothetical protein M5R36_19805 [Deltaproteobacteria bacterium]|nr:hypothetical protein [Deltaproteobacteria bacterium]
MEFDIDKTVGGLFHYQGPSMEATVVSRFAGLALPQPSYLPGADGRLPHYDRRPAQRHLEKPPRAVHIFGVHVIPP